MNFSETEQIANWTQQKRGRLTALAQALGLDRRTLHGRINGYRMTTISIDEVQLHQGIIENKEREAIKLLAALKTWIEQRSNRKKALATKIGVSCSAISKWLNAGVQDTCLIDRLTEIDRAIDHIEDDERNDYVENRRIVNKLVKAFNQSNLNSVNSLSELARHVIQFSNAKNKTVTVFYGKGKIASIGWSINSLSIGYLANCKKTEISADEIGSIEMAVRHLTKNQKIDIAICVGSPCHSDIEFLKNVEILTIFNDLSVGNLKKALKGHNVTVCDLS